MAAPTVVLNWHEQQVYWMVIRYRLKQMMQQPDADLPVMLYWLAVSDRSTYYQFSNSLSRHYLEQCITNYSDHEYARKRFEEFELLMIVSFSGSGGIKLPIEIREDITRLRKTVYPPT